MLKRFIVFLMLISSYHLMYAQYYDTISVQKKLLWKNSYGYLGKDMSPKQLCSLMQNDLEAMVYMKKAKTNFDTGLGFTIMAGLGLGYALYSDLRGGDNVWDVATIGGGSLIAIGIPLFIAYHKHSKTAVSIYNSNKLKKMKLSSASKDIRLSFGLNNSGIGLSLRF